MLRAITLAFTATILLVHGSAQGEQTVPLYGTFELTLTSAPGDDPFQRFAAVSFSQDDRTVRIDGFYDGDGNWRARFLADSPGQWSYQWELDGKTGQGSFVCSAQRISPLAHGHIIRDRQHSRFLAYRDGTPFYWFGGKWIAANHYAVSQDEPAGQNRLNDELLLGYLDVMQQLGHNGLLLKTALYAINDDLKTYDTAWLNRAEWLLKEMGRRGIYCQITFFDTWSRKRGQRHQFDTSGPNQVFDVWAESDLTAKENYIRTIVARFAGFYNVMWELGNEMEHKPNSGDAFVALANKHYIPWIRKYDPYDLPIGLSEKQSALRADVDIIEAHQTDELPPPDADRPWMMNELVRGWKDAPLWDDKTIRNPAHRLGYRQTYWRLFTAGGSGASQATWLKLEQPLNQAVLDVMGDQMRLRKLIDSLPVSINLMLPLAEFIAAPGEHRTRGLEGQCYVTYFLGKSDATQISAKLSPGQYLAQWYDPATGEYRAESAIVASVGAAQIQRPAIAQDAVLVITRR